MGEAGLLRGCFWALGSKAGAGSAVPALGRSSRAGARTSASYRSPTNAAPPRCRGSRRLSPLPGSSHCVQAGGRSNAREKAASSWGLWGC